LSKLNDILEIIGFNIKGLDTQSVSQYSPISITPNTIETKTGKFNILNLIRCKYDVTVDNGNQKYYIIPAYPARGILYVTEDNPEYISGQIRERGKDQVRYPYRLLEMIDAIFGCEENTIEVCSYSVKGLGGDDSRRGGPEKMNKN
jgi:hypothetical protein